MTTKKAPPPRAAISTVKQGAKFGVVGVSNTLIDFTIFTTVKVVLGIPLENVYLIKYFSGSIAMINSFYWNRRWVFKSRARLDQSAVKFLTTTLVSVYLIQPTLVRIFTATDFGQSFGYFWYYLASYMHIIQLAPDKLTTDFVISTAAFGVGVVGSAIWNFTLYKLWAFKK